MTDMAASTASPHPHSSDETTHAQPKPEPVQLRFPTIDLNTSLESLLDHSTCTVSEASTIMPTHTPPQPAMDESWASLDVSDFSHDDEDTQSVNSDAGSLVDLSSVHDTESAAEDDSQSEMGVDEERVLSMLRRGAEQAGQPDQQEVPPYEAMEDTVIFQPSATQHTSSAIDMEYVRDVPWTSHLKVPVRETITMAISPNDLEPFDTPVRIYYYGSRNPPHTRDELLGKIGAALLTPSSNSSSRTSTGSTCFNIVPTEFGPGSKPAFADLIPSQAQMTVDELSVVIDPSETYDNIRFASTRGVLVDSEPANPPKETDRGELDPDLLVIHLTMEDASDDYKQFFSLFRLAARHCWPTLVVADDAGVAPSISSRIPKRYGIQVDSTFDQFSSRIQARRPVDVDTFMAMDTVQLSRHIMHIMETRFVRLDEGPREDAITEKSSSSVSKIRRFVSGEEKREKGYALRDHGGISGSPPSALPERSLSETVRQVWSTMEVRQHVKDVVLTMIVMMLGIYIVGFNQNLTSKVNGLRGLDNTTMVSTQTQGTATVTATSAITPSTANAAVMVDQDVALYDPILFDQMWQRLTGRPVVEQEGEKASKEIKVEEVAEEPAEVVKEPDRFKDAVDQVAGWLQSKLDMVRMRVAQQKVPKPMKSLNKLKKQMEVQELHQKLQDFYKDVTANVPKLSLAKQGYLHDLVARSHHHLKQTRWAGEKRLERLIAEQKTLLSHAQHHAQHIVAAKKKRRSIFRRRG